MKRIPKISLLLSALIASCLLSSCTVHSELSESAKPKTNERLMTVYWPEIKNRRQIPGHGMYMDAKYLPGPINLSINGESRSIRRGKVYKVIVPKSSFTIKTIRSFMDSATKEGDLVVKAGISEPYLRYTLSYGGNTHISTFGTSLVVVNDRIDNLDLVSKSFFQSETIP